MVWNRGALREYSSLAISAEIVVVMLLSVSFVNAQSGTFTVHDTYSDKIADSYNYRFGKDHPFLPSNIQTGNGEFINPKNFPTAQYCGHCHQEAHSQWRQSAHSNSNRASLAATCSLEHQRENVCTSHGCHREFITKTALFRLEKNGHACSTANIAENSGWQIGRLKCSRSDDSRFKASISREVASERACRNIGFEVRFGFWVKQHPFGLSSDSICSPEST
jgi:hypothetical protein